MLTSFGLFIVIIGSLAAQWLAVARLLVHLRQRHPMTYKTLGCPTFRNLFSRSSDAWPFHWKLFKFLFSGGHFRLRDSVVAKLGTIAAVSPILVVLAFVVLANIFASK